MSHWDMEKELKELAKEEVKVPEGLTAQVMNSIESQGKEQLPKLIVAITLLFILHCIISIVAIILISVVASLPLALSMAGVFITSQIGAVIIAYLNKKTIMRAFN